MKRNFLKGKDMVAKNDITGDKIQTREVLSKEGEANFERIFGKRKTNGGWKPTSVDTPVPTTHKPLEFSEDWQSESRARAIGQNGNIGYELEEDK